MQNSWQWFDSWILFENKTFVVFGSLIKLLVLLQNGWKQFYFWIDIQLSWQTSKTVHFRHSVAYYQHLYIVFRFGPIEWRERRWEGNDVAIDQCVPWKLVRLDAWSVEQAMEQNGPVFWVLERFLIFRRTVSKVHDGKEVHSSQFGFLFGIS